jgi:hypothetical protein
VNRWPRVVFALFLLGGILFSIPIISEGMFG